MNEEDEENARSESNSGGSSPSDLKKLLQHHPLPNEGTRLAGRVISISRRLSRKRDFQFHGTNGRIEEKVESEEAVEQEATLSKKRSFSDLKARDARARRRAIIRLGNETDRKPSEGSASDSTANRYWTLVEGKVEKVSERHSERQPSPLKLEVLTNDDTQRHCSSLSARLYRDQEEAANNGSSSQRNNAFKHLVCSNSSCENSPKVELQSVSPVSLRNSSRGSMYRRFGGVILQNLSSGSEAESNFEENLKAGSSRPFVPRGIDISPSNLRVNDPSVRNFNDEHPISSQAHVDSSRHEYHGNVASSVSRTDFGKNRLRQGCNDRLAFALPLGSPSKAPRDGSFCKILQSSRSDCGQSAKKETADEEPMFFSARRKIRDYNVRRKHGSQPVASVLDTFGILPDVSKNLPNNSEGSSREKIFNQNDQEIVAKRYLNHLSENQTSSTCESVCSENADYARVFDRNATSTPKSIASPEAYGVQSFTMFQYVPGDKNLAFHSPNAQTFKEAISRCILNYETNNETNVPRSLSNASEDQSAASSLREYFVNDFRAASSQNENFYSPRSAGNSQGTHSLCSNRVKEFAMNVPTLVLNSREASPSGKDCSEGRLDPNTLIMALSNASLKRRTAAAENTCSESCADSKTVSRLGSSENDLSTGQSRLARSRRSKIPVKIPSDRGKLSIRGNNKTDESDKRMIAPVDYTGPSFRSNSSSPEGFQFDREDTTESSANGGSRSVENESEDTRFAEILIESSMKTDLANVEKSGVALTGARSRNRLSSRVEISDDRRSKSKRKEENPNCNESGVDSLKFSTFADNSRKSEEKEEQSTLKQDISSANESDSFSPGKSVKNLEEQLEASRESSFFLNVADFPLENYQSTYERGFSPRMADERTTNSFENQTGNGGCREIPSEDSERSKSSSTSPEGEEPTKPRENRDKLRFSIERLAADQFRRCLNLEQAKTIQSDTATFFSEKTLCEVGQFTVAGSSSTSRLRHDRSRDSPRFKKRSQDRFPFTISEKTSIASTKFKVPGRLADLDEDEEDRGYKLDTHPSITRLAGSEFEDSPADIVSYVARTELSDRCAKSSGMRGLVKKFSAKWRKSRRRESTNAADVIYKNRDYREECESSNCSELSSLREFKIYESTEEKLCEPEPNPDSPDEKSSVVCDRASSDGESKNKNTPSSAENPCRRYDRDDLWVQALKDLDSDRERGKTKNAEADEDKLQDRYSVFFVKSARGTPEQSAKAPQFALVDENRKQDSVSTERRKNRVKFRGSLTVTPESTEDVLLEELARNENSERVRRDRKNAQSECFCLRFYRMIVSISLGSISKCRSRIDEDSSSVKRKKSCASLRKKKG
ncbi:hypothetical protein K0M31_002476 [Melipona bicolor]|uniref:Uncharacterized protein n=1 Tax=Melipona bicolor TaxID=60889 RepID=A0AA40GHL6_9HYME|nr:hypothetical protein K0M31_002476 [Melipona bicolor]